VRSHSAFGYVTPEEFARAELNIDMPVTPERVLAAIREVRFAKR
jgi:hypothetical protein